MWSSDSRSKRRIVDRYRGRLVLRPSKINTIQMTAEFHNVAYLIFVKLLKSSIISRRFVLESADQLAV